MRISSTRIADRPTQAANSLSEQELDRSRGLSLGESLKSISGVTSLNTGNSIAAGDPRPAQQPRAGAEQRRSPGEPAVGQRTRAGSGPVVASELSVVKGAAGVRYGPDAIAGW